MKKNLFTYIILSYLFISCASAPEFIPYEGYRYGHREGGNTHQKHMTIEYSKVRVWIYSGPAVAVYSKNFTYKPEKGEIISGQGSFNPAFSGTFTPKSGTFRFNGKTYIGTLQIYNIGKKYLYVNQVPMKEYLVSVISHEMNPSWPVEALKAQAIVARTYVLRKMKANAKLKYDIGSSTYDQVYGGRVENPGNALKAVEDTANLAITFEGELAEVYYHSDCGGETAAASEVWKVDLPYLVRKRCEFRESPEYSWEVVYSRQQVEKAFGLEDIQNITITQRTPSQRAKTIVITTRRSKKAVTADYFRSVLGSSKIRSTRFAIRKNGSNYIVRGRGFGHGVGLCQWCAKIMVEKNGMNHRAILRFFFPGTKIEVFREPKKR